MPSADKRTDMHDARRILIIEDDEDYRRLVGAVFACSDEAFEVETAATLAEGLGSVERFHPEIILVDLNLPDSTGYETFLRVQAQSDGVPIVVVTALDDEHTAVQAVKDGAQDYIVKSLIQPKLVLRSINMALQLHRCGLAGSKRYVRGHTLRAAEIRPPMSPTAHQ